MIKRLIMFCILTMMLIPLGLTADQTSEMMQQYLAMGQNTSNNFPKNLEGILPKSFKLKAKHFVYEETAKMFLIVAISGTKEDTVYKNFPIESVLEIGVMAYNPQLNPHMSPQFDIMQKEQKKALAVGETEKTSSSTYEKPAIIKVGQQDLYLQKQIVTYQNDETNKTETHIYYHVKAAIVKKNILFQINLQSYPAKSDEAVNIAKDILKFLNNYSFDKLMN